MSVPGPKPADTPHMAMSAIGGTAVTSVVGHRSTGPVTFLRELGKFVAVPSVATASTTAGTSNEVDAFRHRSAGICVACRSEREPAYTAAAHQLRGIAAVP
jgi:hypothetical protein